MSKGDAIPRENWSWKPKEGDVPNPKVAGDEYRRKIVHELTVLGYGVTRNTSSQKLMMLLHKAHGIEIGKPKKTTAKKWVVRYATTGYLNGCSRGAKVRQKKRKRDTEPDYVNSNEFLMSWEWRKLRYKVIKKFGAVCMCCRSTDKIHVDHIKPRRKYPELALDFNNLQVLCEICNMGKSAWDETDWRPNESQNPTS